MEQRRCLGCMRIKGPGEVCEHCGYREGTPNAPHQLTAGAVLKEQYRIGRVLGQGGFGITYLGWDLYLDIPVAIKEYYPSGMVMRDTAVTMAVADITGGGDGRFHHSRDRFMREAKMLARFSQLDEVVQVKNFFLANNTAYIVMEYVEGITLKQYVKDRGGRISPREAFDILRPVIRTLSRVHKTGIIHRDISPDNIMMLPEGGAKLLDFGAVRSVGEASVEKELTKSTEAILKQGYAPLEQYQKKGALGPWTDVYAMCATLYFCITGTVPPDAPARVLGYEELDLNALTELTEQQREALRHGMELRAENRTPDMETMYRELFAAPAPVPVPEPIPEPKPEPEPKPVQRTEKTSGRKRTSRKGGLVLAAAALIAVLALAIAVGIGLNGGNTGDTPGQAQSGAAIVDSGKCGNNLEWTLDENGVLTISGNDPMDDYYADWYNDDLRQGRTLPPWQDHSEQISKVVAADNLSRVGDAAFNDCVNLTEVEFGGYVTEIGMDAFRNTGLTEVTLPDSLTYISFSAFEGTRLRHVVLPDSVKAVEHSAFGNCRELESVTLGVNTRLCFDIRNNMSTFNRGDDNYSAITLRGPRNGMVEDYAKLYGHTFEEHGETLFEKKGYFGDIPTGGTVSWQFDKQTRYLRIIGQGPMAEDLLGTWEKDQDHSPEHAYDDLSYQPWLNFQDEISTVYIDDRITNIPPNCFENCHYLTDIYIGNSVESIGFQSFLSTNVDEIVLPESVRFIDGFAFNYCQNLRVVVLPLALEELHWGVFNMCPNMEQLYLGNNVTIHYDLEEDNTPFSNGHEEAEYPRNLTIYSPQEGDGKSVAPAKQFADDLGISYQVGIFHHEFAEAMGQMVYGKSDTYWVFQDGVLTLLGKGETPFFRTENSDRRAWGVRQPDWKLVDGEAPWYPYRNRIYAVVVDPGVTVLNRGALCDLPNLEHLNLGSVRAIGSGAIDNCGLEQMWINDTTHTIEALAITDCPNLRRLEIHNGCGYLGQGALKGNTALEELYFFSGGEKFSGELFDGVGPDNLTIYARPDSPAEKYAAEHGHPCETVPW